MATESQWEILKSPLGYEIAILALSSPVTRRDIREKLPYAKVDENQYERILERGYENDIFEILDTRGMDKYAIVEGLFSEREQRELNKRALLRIVDPPERQEEPPQLEDISDDFFFAFQRDQVERISNGSDCAADNPDVVDKQLRFSTERDKSGKDASEETPEEFGPDGSVHTDVAYVESKYSGIDKAPWEE